MATSTNKHRINTREIAALIGKRVVFSQKAYVFEKLYGDRRGMAWGFMDTPPRTGWIVGLRFLQNGYRDNGYNCEDDYQAPRFVDAAPRTPVLLVVTWPTEKPWKVPMDGWRDVTAEDPPPQPSGIIPADDDYRACCREQASKMPRVGGRFVPCVWRDGQYVAKEARK